MQGFISYAHDDYADFKRLQLHLKSIEVGTRFHFWCDERLKAGYDWHATILSEVRKSSVFLFLASPNYFGARYVIEQELPAIRAHRGDCDILLIPVILHSCDWQGLFEGLQAVPVADERRVLPISNWHSKEEGFNAAREQIHQALKAKFKIETVPVICGHPSPTDSAERNFSNLARELRRMGRLAKHFAGDFTINQPEILDQLRPVMDLADRLAESAHLLPNAELISQLQLLEGIVENCILTDFDPDSEEPMEALIRAHGAVGSIRMHVARAIGIATASDFGGPFSVENDRLLLVKRAEIGDTALGGLSEKVANIEKQLLALQDILRTTPPTSVLAAELINNFIGRMGDKVVPIRLTIDRVDVLNFRALKEMLEVVTQLSSNFQGTVSRMGQWLAPQFELTAGNLQTATNAAFSTVQRLVRKLLTGVDGQKELAESEIAARDLKGEASLQRPYGLQAVSSGSYSSEFWSTLLKTGERVSIFTGALLSNDHAREMISDWDVRSTAELASFFGRNLYSPVIERPLYEYRSNYEDLASYVDMMLRRPS